MIRKMVFEMKLTMMMMRGTAMINTLSTRYIGHHSSQ